MSHIFTLQLVEAGDRYVGYVLDDGHIRCLLCGASLFGKDNFDWHLNHEHDEIIGGRT